MILNNTLCQQSPCAPLMGIKRLMGRAIQFNQFSAQKNTPRLRCFELSGPKFLLTATEALFAWPPNGADLMEIIAERRVKGGPGA